VFLNVMQNVTGINNGAFTKNRQATSKEDCLCSNEGKNQTICCLKKRIAKRAKLAKFLKYGIKPGSNLTAPGMTFGSLSANKSAEFFRCPPKL
jgi:hypothetical protein